jgi:hypothetical protein
VFLYGRKKEDKKYPKNDALKLPTPLYTFIVLLRFDALKIYI